MDMGIESIFDIKNCYVYAYLSGNQKENKKIVKRESKISRCFFLIVLTLVDKFPTKLTRMQLISLIR